MVASAGSWSEQVKLVNLITRLRGSAYSFYQSCTPDQRSSYKLLKQALIKRFTPVFLRSVRSSQFHERRQQPNESVDSFAQELKKLFYRAYPVNLQGSKEAEATLRSVLTSQFIAGLKSNIKAGVDGDFEELLIKARFEEARLRDFQPHKPPPSNATPKGLKDHQGTRRDQPTSTPKSGGGSTPKKRVCYGCGSKTHLLPDCQQRRRGAPAAWKEGYLGSSPDCDLAISIRGSVRERDTGGARWARRCHQPCLGQDHAHLWSECHRR